MHDKPPFSQNIIAMIWDFDLTLSPHYMQRPLFQAYGIDEAQFWTEVRGLPDYYLQRGVEVNQDTCYLGHILTYVQHGLLPDLTNQRLRELGGQIEFFPGVPQIFAHLEGVLQKPEFQRWELQLEHYVVSTGLKAMIEGSAIAPYLSGIWACEFIEQPAPPGLQGDGGPSAISQIAELLDNTTKTRAIFEINKGVNKHPRVIKVNDVIPENERRIPIHQMIYIADGPSDVPSFSIMKKHGGIAFGVYDPNSRDAHRKADSLRSSRRVDHIGVADFTPQSQTTHWLEMQLESIAERIAEQKQRALESSRTAAPGHS